MDYIIYGLVAVFAILLWFGVIQLKRFKASLLKTVEERHKIDQSDDARDLLAESRWETSEEENLNFDQILEKLENYSPRAQATFIYRLVVMLPIEQIDNLEKYVANRRIYDEKRTTHIRTILRDAVKELPKRTTKAAKTLAKVQDRDFNTPEAFNDSVIA